MIDLEDCIACVNREIARRVNMYPRAVALKRMTQAKADSEIAQMRQVLALLLAEKSKRPEGVT